MVRHIATASAVVFFLAYAGAVTAFAPVTPISRLNDHNAASSPRVASMEQCAVSLPSISLPSVDTSSLTQYLLETVISNGVPAFFWIAVIAFAAKSFKSAKQASGGDGPNGGLFSSQSVVAEIYDDLYGSSPQSQRPSFPFSPRGGKSTPKNLGVPKDEYLKITKLNDKYQSFDYSLTAATQSKAKAAAMYRSKAFDSALQRSFDSSIEEITPAQKSDLLAEEKAFLAEGGNMLENLTRLQVQLTELIIREEMKGMDVEIGEVDAHPKDVLDATIIDEKKDDSEKKSVEKKDKKKDKKSVSKLVKEIEKENTALLRLEMEFIRTGTCTRIIVCFVGLRVMLRRKQLNSILNN